MQIQEFENIDCAYCGKIIYFCSYKCYRQWIKKYKAPKEED